MNDIKQTIQELELSLLKPEVRASFDALNMLLADDFYEIGNSGLAYNKTMILERLPKNLSQVVYTVSDFSIKVLSENIVLTNFKTKRVTDGTDAVISLRSSLWRRVNGIWQIVLHQGTPTSE